MIATQTHSTGQAVERMETPRIGNDAGAAWWSKPALMCGVPARTGCRCSTGDPGPARRSALRSPPRASAEQPYLVPLAVTALLSWASARW
jgi:hypothetical protein